MAKLIKYLIIIVLLVKQSISDKCDQVEFKVECKRTNKEALLNSLLIKIETLDLSFNKLEDKEIQAILLNGIDQSVKVLNVSHNELLILYKNQFSKLNKLEILDLSYNQLYYIELNAFNGLDNVLELYLQNNHLTELYPNSLNNLQKCKYINLDSNKILKIRNNVFKTMTSLEILSFEFNRLEQVESNAFKGLTNLKNLSFYWNKLTSFDQVDLSKSQVKNLNLSFNQIESFIMTSINDKVLTLDLSSNKMRSFYYNGGSYITEFKNLILSNNNIINFKISSNLNLNS
jgi:Leucine-rich repeat (LRR) protein